jgi:hypothetical protein
MAPVRTPTRATQCNIPEDAILYTLILYVGVKCCKLWETMYRTQSSKTIAMCCARDAGPQHVFILSYTVLPHEVVPVGLLAYL